MHKALELLLVSQEYLWCSVRCTALPLAHADRVCNRKIFLRSWAQMGWRVALASHLWTEIWKLSKSLLPMQAYVQASPLTVKPLGTAKNYKRSVNVSVHFDIWIIQIPDPCPEKLRKYLSEKILSWEYYTILERQQSVVFFRKFPCFHMGT